MRKMIFFLFVLLPTISYAQEIFLARNKLDVVVNVTVERDFWGNLDYRYKVTNEPHSAQIIAHIGIKPPGPEGNVEVPSTWNSWYSIVVGNLAMGPGKFKDDDPMQNPPLDSIGPGESLDDFGILNHKGPPQISTWSILGWAPVPKLDEERGVIVSGGVEYKIDEWGDTIMNHSHTLPNAHTGRNRINVMTIGPSKPSEDLAVICDTFILDLIVQVREAAALGWIKHDLRKDGEQGIGDRGQGKGKIKDKHKTKKDDDADEDDRDDSDLSDADRQLPGVAPSVKRDILSRSGDDALPGIAKSIIQKLTKVRRECMHGELSGAREKLRALIKQTEAQRGKHLTDEAYYLIKFNVEYLLENL